MAFYETMRDSVETMKNTREKVLKTFSQEVMKECDSDLMNLDEGNIKNLLAVKWMNEYCESMEKFNYELTRKLEKLEEKLERIDKKLDQKGES